jgi:predicted phosphodiesterase
MERTRKIQKKPDAILTGDWHLREDTPTAFVGDFQAEQWKAVGVIYDLQEEYDCKVINTGDLFNIWKPSPWLLSMAILRLPKKFHTIYGNHDLPQHNLELADKCGINVLKAAMQLNVLPGVHWGQIPDGDGYLASHGRIICPWHVMTYQGKKLWPGMTDPIAASLLRKYPMYDLIVTGHNHIPFVEEHEGRLLVNPGGITRQTADQIDFRPRVYLWYADTNTVEPYFLPFTEGAVSREHIDQTEERDARIDAFISRLDGDWSASMSFEENLEAFAQANNINPKVMEIVNKALES